MSANETCVKYRPFDVFIEKSSENSPDWADNAHASFRAVEQLIQANHRKIAILNGRPHSWVSQERLRGYLEAMHTYDHARRTSVKRSGELILKRIRDDYTDFPQKIELKTKLLLRDSVRKLEP